MVTQHARVTLQRIERAISGSTANEQFPGCVVFSGTVGSWEFPDTLVVWRGDIAVANPDGGPLFSELVIYCPDPFSPNRLLEITLPDYPYPVPELSNTYAWRMYLGWIKYSGWSNKTELTDRVRAPSTNGAWGRRGAV